VSKQFIPVKWLDVPLTKMSMPQCIYIHGMLTYDIKYVGDLHWVTSKAKKTLKELDTNHIYNIIQRYNKSRVFMCNLLRLELTRRNDNVGA